MVLSRKPKGKSIKIISVLVAFLFMFSLFPVFNLAISQASEKSHPDKAQFSQKNSSFKKEKAAKKIEKFKDMGYVPGQVIVKFKKDSLLQRQSMAKSKAGIKKLLKKMGLKGKEDICLFELKKGQSVDEAIKELKASDDVLIAEPNYVHKRTYTPNDTYFNRQWGFNNTGQTIEGVTGISDVDIDAPEGWDIEKGDTNPVTVAVIDSGIDAAHPDLASKIWQNTDEIAGNGIDDDYNGYVDDTFGYNFEGIHQSMFFNAVWSMGEWEASQMAQSIKGTGQPLTHIGLLLAKEGSPSFNIIVSVRSNLYGGDLATATIYPEDVGIELDEVYKALDMPVTLNSGSTYYIVFRVTDFDYFNHYWIFDNSNTEPYYEPDPYTEGSEYWWKDVTWCNYAADDFYFITNPNANPRDDNGHGTHVSGIVGADTDNSTGVAGTCPGAKIMPLKGSLTTTQTIDAIYYAVDNGAKVINMSLVSPYYSSLEQSAVNYAYNNGVVLFAAAGNGGITEINYPAGYSNVIGVGAVNNRGQADFSNHNISVDISAPGESIYSTMPTYSVGMNSGGYYQNYDYCGGTSMSSPMAAGLAALMLSQNPSLTPLGVEEAMKENADDLGASGRDDYFGYGCINVYATLNSLPAYLPTTATFVIGQSSYTLNGVTTTMDAASYIKNSRTYVPVRYLAYVLGVADSGIGWNAETQTVTLTKEGTTVTLVIGSKIRKINGVSSMMDVAPEITNGRTMLPARWVAEAFGATVGWNSLTRTVTIEY